MANFRFFTFSAVVMVLIIIAGGCKKTPTEETFELKLLLDPNRVAVIPGGTEEIKVTTTDEHNSPRTFSVYCEDKVIATATKTDSTTITVTGLSVGKTIVTVTSDTNIRTFPVQVYDPKVMETDELIIGFVDTFEYRWSSEPAGGRSFIGSFYHPVTTDGFHALGSVDYAGEYADPSGKMWATVVKAKPGSDALKPPVDYEFVWCSEIGYNDFYGSFWNPIPPAGYRALGTVVQRGFSRPNLNDVVCVRADLTVLGIASDTIYTSYNDNLDTLVIQAFLIDPPNVGPHLDENCYLSTGTFQGMASPYRSNPPPPVVYVLSIKLPVLADAPEQSYIPKLSGYDTPPEKTEPLLAKEILVPWTLLRDGNLGDIWRLNNSPFYRLERQVYYKRRDFLYNQASGKGSIEIDETCGTDSTKSQTFLEETNVEVKWEAGVSLMYQGSGGTGTYASTESKKLGYETQTAITELKTTTLQQQVDVLPGKAAAIWQKCAKFILKRHNGTTLEPVAAWELGINSWVADDYPDEE
jgi:hypothetical protein